MHWTLMLWLSFGTSAFANPPTVPDEALRTLAPEAVAALEEMSGDLQATEQALTDLREAAQAAPAPTPVETAELAVRAQVDAMAAAKEAGDKRALKEAKAVLKAATADLEAAIAAGAPAPAAPPVDPAELANLEARRALLAASLELARARAVVAAGAEMDLAPYEEAVRVAGGEVPAPAEGAAAPEAAANAE